MRYPALHGGHPLAVVLAIVALLATVTPARAEWSSETLTGSFYLTRPSLAIGPDDVVDIAYQRTGSDGGIYFATNASGTWASERLTAGDHWAPNLVLGPAGVVHIAYVSFGADAGIHYLTNGGGTWADTRLTTGMDAALPQLALDTAGKVHIAYPELGAQPGIYYVTNESGAWVRTRVAAGTHDWSPDLAFDAGGTLHLLFASFAPESKGLYYQQRKGAAWTAPSRVTSSYDDLPALAVDPAGSVHVAFQRFGPLPDEPYRGQLFYATNASGSWAFDRLPMVGGDHTGPPAIAFDKAGVVTIAACESSNSGPGTLHVLAGTIGAWGYVGSSGYGGYAFPSIAFDSRGVLHHAERSATDRPGIEHWVGFGMEELVAVSVTDAAASLDVAADGTRHLAFARYLGGHMDRGIHYGDDRDGWAFERVEYGTAGIDAMAGWPDLAVAPDGSVRLINTDGVVQLGSNASGSWTVTQTQLCTEGSLAVDAAGKAHVACRGRDWATLDYYSETSGAFAGGTIVYPVYSGEAYRDPAIAVDATGRRTIVVAMTSEATTPGLFVISAAAGASWPTKTSRLWTGDFGEIDATAGPGSAVHAVYVDYGTSPGVYYVTNQTGTWVRTRLTRSRVDYAPSIEVDAAGKVYIAFMRGGAAAYPGLYATTNRAGAWTTYRVTGSPAGEPSLALGTDGKLDIAYADGVAGVRILDETTGLGGMALGSWAAGRAIAEVLASGDGGPGATARPEVSSTARDAPASVGTPAAHPIGTEREAVMDRH